VRKSLLALSGDKGNPINLISCFNIFEDENWFFSPQSSPVWRERWNNRMETSNLEKHYSLQLCKEAM